MTERFPMPVLPPGKLRELLTALHELHRRAGWPSLREMASGRAFSHTSVHNLFTKTTSRAPRLEVLLAVVEFLASKVRKLDVDATVDQFDRLWLEASMNPFDATDHPEPNENANSEAQIRPGPVEDDRLELTPTDAMNDNGSPRPPPEQTYRGGDAAQHGPDGHGENDSKVLALMADGLSDRQIADELHLSEREVTGLVRELVSRFGASNRAALAVWADRTNITVKGS